MSAPAHTVTAMPAAAGTLRRTLESGRFVVAPGVFDMISAMLAERVGFDADALAGV